jgi:subtilase family serine protease
MAPGAKIVYVAGHSCQNMDLDNALNTIVAGHLAQIVSNSYGNLGEAVNASNIKFYNAELVEAAAKGIGVYFSSGDSADEIFNLGVPSPDFPASHPLVTAVGGTSLAVNAATSGGGTYGFETGWETGKSYLCTKAVTPLLGACTGAPVNSWQPPAPGFLVYGSGGGTSHVFAQPAYQQGVVPASVSQRNGPHPMRAVPDVAADGDPTTGMLIGQTQVFPTGTFWDTYRIGGTSLSSPLFAGMMAVADQVAGFAHGFANPALYMLTGTSAFHDITANGKISDVRVDFLNTVDASAGTFTTQRTFGYQGPETFCSTPTSCIVRPLTLHATPGWDNETGNGTPNGMAFFTALK